MRKTAMIALVCLAQAALLAACAGDSERILFTQDEPSLDAPAYDLGVGTAGEPGLYVGRFANSEWSEPVHLPAPINSPYGELTARFSPDELSIYFQSDRPGGYGGWDMWVSRRACLDCPWGEAVNLGPELNSAGREYEPVFSPDGLLLFFTSSREGGAGSDDIWVASRTDPNDDFSWGPPVNIGPGVNTPGQDNGGAYVPALEGGGVNLYFTRAGDIYQTRVMRDGRVVAPVTPVAELNDPNLDDWEPSVRTDGREVFFWRGGGADIWVARRQSVHEPWSAPQRLGPPVNTPFADMAPGLSFDGRTLLFSETAAARPGLGRQDIWMSTRTPSGQ